MCIMIYCPEGRDFPVNKVPDFYSGNRDGLGIFWASHGKLHVSRSLPRNANEAKETLRKALDEVNGSPMVAHFRYATHGTVSLANVHPFEIRKELVLAHNGVLNIDTVTGQTDTQAFIARYLKPLLRRSRDPISALNGPLGGLVGEAITGSKFAAMDTRGNVALINEKDGTWKNGIWFSNMYWEKTWRVTDWEKHPRLRGMPGYDPKKDKIGPDDWAYF